GGSTHNAGVPSALERQGDFAEICNSGFDSTGLCKDRDPNDPNQVIDQLWDPYSGTYVAGTGRVLQTPIPFNNLATFQSAGNPNLKSPYQLAAAPGNLIDPVAAKMITYYPKPNVGVDSQGNPIPGVYDPYNNWSGSGINVN